ncbi:MAG: DUF6056 family protein [Kofleriaceae bacterium]
MKRTLATWAAVIVPVWIVMVLCTHWEPVQRDGWGHFIWQRHTGLSLANLVEFARGSYEHNNPRLGQVVTLLMFTPGPWHVIFTPLLELATFYALVALVLGRWPRTAGDAQLFLVTFAITAATAPQFGLLLFYRPFTGNYVFGLFATLAFLLPYRFGRVGWWIVPLGFAAGLCNEHTGPAIVALAAAATWASGVRAWKVAGIVAMCLGGLALLVAPGQAIRYNGIAQTSLVERLAERGIAGNLEIVGAILVYLLPALAWLAVAGGGWWFQQRRRTRVEPPYREQRRAELALVATALAIVLTLLLSPKVGPRLYFASCAMIAAVIANIALRHARAAITALSALVVAIVAIICVRAYQVAGARWTARVATWEHSPAITDPPPVEGPRSRWILDDDQTQPEYRALAAQAFAIMPR